MQIKKLVCLLIAFILLSKLIGQTVTNPDLNKSLIPPSPEASSLGKYGVQPVTLYSGMANVSVPLAELRSTKLRISLDLSYNYNGYRPGDEPGSVGLGWSLTGGGVITRILQGKVDGDPNLSHHWNDYSEVTDMTQNMDFMELVGEGQVDTQPDIYIFNFNGHSGKFILVGNRAYTYPHQQLNVTFDGANFKIVDETGVAYYFQDKDTTTPAGHQPNQEFIPQYVSSWFLTKIISADYADEIDFSYTKWIQPQRSSAYSDVYHTQNGGYKGQNPCNGTNCLCDVFSSISYAGGAISANILSKISSRNGYINLIPDVLYRKDLNSTTAHALSELDVYDNSNTLIKKINLFHSYFGDSSNSLYCHLKLTGLELKGFYNNRLLGSSSSNDSIDLPDYYSFQYYNENGSYPKLTRAIDRWGYYNGKNNSMLFEGDFLGYTPLLPGADRSVDVSKSISGCLKKITFPTGGFTTFDYEDNMVGAFGDHGYTEVPKITSVTANYSSGDSTNAGDVFTLNEEQTIGINFGRQFDGSIYPYGVFNNKNIVRIYADNGESLGALLYTSKQLGKSSTSASDSLHLPMGLYHVIVTCESSSISSYATINYKWVDSIPYQGDPGPGLRIAAIKSYNNINAGQPALTKTYSYCLSTLLSSSGLGVTTTAHSYGIKDPNATNDIDPNVIFGVYNEYTYTYNFSSLFAGILDNQFYYPTVTEFNYDTTGAGKTVYEYISGGTSDATGILLNKQSDYSYKSNSYVLLKQKVTNYDFKDIINIPGFTYHMNQVLDPGQYPPPPLEDPDILDTIVRARIFDYIPYSLSSIKDIITSTDETSYDQDGNNPMTIHTDYYYDNPSHVQPTRLITLNSKGDTIVNQNKYPLDYALALCGSLYSIDTTFKAAQYNISAAYQAAILARHNYLMQYYNSSVPNSQNTSLLNAFHNYTPNCEGDYMTSYASSLNTMNSGVTSFYSCAQSNGLSNGSLTAAQKGIMLMQSQNMAAVPVEQIVSIRKAGGNEYLFGATKTDFLANSRNGVNPADLYITKGGSSLMLKSDFLNTPSSYYLKEVNFKYDNYNNIKEQSKTNDLKTSYLWDYSNAYPTAQITLPEQASLDDIQFFAYTSFESTGTGNWTIPSSLRQNAAITGAKSYDLSNGSISATTLDNTKAYFLSYWAQTGATVNVSGASTPSSKTTRSGWTLYEALVSGSSSVTLSGSGNIDELRLFPKSAQMTTYTYDPLIGLTSSCDAKGQIFYYEYDALGRLRAIRDADQHILKYFEYKYKVSYSTYLNVEKTGTFTRNDCPAGQTGSAVTYTVPARTYSSQVSQAAADALAQSDIDNNGQAYANTNATCSSTVNLQSTNYMSVSGFVAVYTNTLSNQQYTFTISSASGSQALGTVPAGTYNVTISKSNNTTSYSFGVCDSWFLGRSASFSNVTLSGSCNTLVIDSGL